MSRVRAGLFRPMELRRCHESHASCPHRIASSGPEALATPAFRCVRFADQDSATDYLRSHVTDADDMMLFRRIVAEDNHTVYRLSDHDVLDDIAAKLTRRALCLLVPVPLDTRPFAEAAPVAVPLPSSAQTPSQYTPRAPEPAAAESDFTDALDQMMQAESLALAARAGVPFCEVCARHAAGAAV